MLFCRDDFQCQKCKKIDRPKKPYTMFSYTLLSIHHIDGDKFNDVDSNLITLCDDCHLVAHNGDFKKKPIEIFHPSIFLNEDWLDDWKNLETARHFVSIVDINKMGESLDKKP